MGKQLLTNTLEKIFESTSKKQLIVIKSALLSLCADIERYFKKYFNISLNKRSLNK